MILPFALVFAALQLPPTAARSDTFPDAYLDPAARSLVELARERRTQVEGRIRQYTVLSRSRVSVGLRALRRDRMFYRCEVASRVEWNRGDTIRIDLLGAREVIPLISGKVRAGDEDCGDSAFDPTADRLGMALGGGMRMDDSSFLKHPLAPRSERDYRFRSGSSTEMRLADGTTIRLRELEVLPRRSEPTLVSGSLWLEDRTHAVVRAVLRLARPFDYDRDFSRTRQAMRNHDDDAAGADGENGNDDDEDEVPRFLRPLRADIRYMSIEYGLWDQQWWLPRLIAFEGEAEIGNLFAVPLKMERSFTEYAVESFAPEEPIPPLVFLPPDSICRHDEGDDDEDTATDGDEVSVSVGTEGTEVEHRSRNSCECMEGRCQVVVIRSAVDSATLIRSEYLPPSIYEDGEAFITEREMADLLGRVETGRRPPWKLAPITWRTGFQGLDLVRYNRVEGLSLGAAANVDLGRAAVDGEVRVGVADLAPNFELAVSRGGAVSRHRLGVYRRLEAVGPSVRQFGVGSSLSALLFGRDDGDYYRSWGLELEREPATGADGLTWRLFGELQRGAEQHTDFSLASAIGDASFRPNILADEADQVGLEARLRGSRGTDPTGWRGGISIGVLGSAGSYNFARPTLTLSGAAPLPGRLLGALELNGGSIFGDAPRQSWFYLGGGSTVRGYGGNSAQGEAYWTARAEVATSQPGARIVVFSDAGWAGAADEVTADPMLLSAGAGISILDGLLRMDLARALRHGSDWRVELQVDAGL